MSIQSSRDAALLPARSQSIRGSGLLTVLRRMLWDFRDALAHERQISSETNRLINADDHMLRDLGISREELRYIVRCGRQPQPSRRDQGHR